jgi:hypothetical protein
MLRSALRTGVKVRKRYDRDTIQQLKADSQAPPQYGYFIGTRSMPVVNPRTRALQVAELVRHDDHVTDIDWSSAHRADVQHMLARLQIAAEQF